MDQTAASDDESRDVDYLDFIVAAGLSRFRGEMEIAISGNSNLLFILQIMQRF